MKKCDGKYQGYGLLGCDEMYVGTDVSGERAGSVFRAEWYQLQKRICLLQLQYMGADVSV